MNKERVNHFNIRIYGLFINEKQEVLLTDEFRQNTLMTKFPGGGLELGEGTIDCLRREMREECNQEIENIQHFYTTDFFQKALFFEDHQLISIYYTAKLREPVQVKISHRAFDFRKTQNSRQSFRWIPVKNINADEFTFPIDKHVANLLIERF